MSSSKPIRPMPSACCRVLDRHIARCGTAPRQTAADGGYASRANLAAAKDRGVDDVAFHKKCGIAIADMVKSSGLYRRLRNFRAGLVRRGRPQPGCCSPASNSLDRPSFVRR
jgi:hypothetical protein